MKTRTLLTSRIAALFLVAASVGMATVARSQTASYHLQLFDKNESVNAPLSATHYFFDVPSKVRFTKGSVHLDYKYSQTLLSGKGSLTLLLNDEPIASKAIPHLGVMGGSWDVVIPVGSIKEGFNEIRVESKQKTFEGPCQDQDNQANWITFAKSSTLNLVKDSRALYPLSSYPFPFLSGLAANPVQGPIFVPTNDDPDIISQALNLSGDWGRRASNRLLRMKVGKSDSLNETGVLFQKTNDFNGIRETADESGSHLLISGVDAKSIASSVQALGRNDLVAQMNLDEVKVQDLPAITTTSPMRPTLGSFSLGDLGQSDIKLAGAFHQKATFTLMRPVRTDLGRTSSLEIHFRHAAALRPERSQLTVLINGTPIASESLTPKNENDGVIKAYIPVEVLAQNRWVVTLEAFHDLSSPDCSKSYDDVAWTLIDADSSFKLDSGLLVGRPYLEGFPYMVGQDGRAATGVTMFLPANPSDAQLSLASTLAARSSRMNGIASSWTTVLGAVKETKNNAIVLTKRSDMAGLASLSKVLLAAPGEGGELKISPKLQFVRGSDAGGVLIQAVPSPWTANGVIYVVMADTDAEVDRLNDYLVTNGSLDKMAGQVALLNQDGELVSIKVTDKNEIAAEKKREVERYTTPMRTILGGLILLTILALVWVALKFVKRQPKAA